MGHTFNVHIFFNNCIIVKALISCKIVQITVCTAVNCIQIQLFFSPFRELLEECGVEGEVLDHVGYLLFEFDDLVMHVHVYTCSEFKGEPCESEGIIFLALFFMNIYWEINPYSILLVKEKIFLLNSHSFLISL